MSLKALFGVLALGMAALAGAATVQVAEGALSGARLDGVEAFKGVPFAAPPLGELRWRAPQAPAAWRGVRDATRYAPACMQGGEPWPPGSTAELQSEDCLYLNVWRPAGLAGQAKLPVMVWIPGGGWTDGSGTAPLYDGSRLARHGVILVTINYRLGAFGFLAHEALSRESPSDSSGNYGLRDQVAALRWIKANIAAFGGDPGRVTIFGQSAGSMSANLLTVSPPARGLFQRVIGQSGAVFIPPEMAGGDAFRLKGAHQEGARFAAALGAATIDDLRRVPAPAIVEAQRRFAFHFILDKDMLPEEPWVAYGEGRQAQVDLLAGWNTDEGQWFIAGQNISAANFEQGIADEIGQFPAPLRPWYQPTSDAQARAARAAFEGDLRMAYDTWTWLRLHEQTGCARVFAYRFEQAPSVTEGAPFFGMGATHGVEMPYVFDALASQRWQVRPSDRQLARSMAAYWTNFAKSGDPNGEGLAPWPQYRATAPGQPPQVMQLGSKLRAAPERGVGALHAIDALFQSFRPRDAAAQGAEPASTKPSTSSKATRCTGRPSSM